jgi:hypothetical protein
VPVDFVKKSDANMNDAESGNVPDGGTTIILLGSAIMGVWTFRRKTA